MVDWQFHDYLQADLRKRLSRTGRGIYDVTPACRPLPAVEILSNFRKNGAPDYRAIPCDGSNRSELSAAMAGRDQHVRRRAGLVLAQPGAKTMACRSAGSRVPTLQR
jgi:hypothetical protein